MKNFWRFAKHILRYRTTIVFALFAAVVSAACFGAGIATIPIILKAMLGDETRSLRDLGVDYNARINNFVPQEWIDRLPTDAFQGVLVVLGLVLALTLIGAVAKYFHTLLAMTACIRTIANIRKAAFYRVIHFPLRSIVAEGTMDSISRIVRDSNQLGKGFTAITSKAVHELFKGAAALVVAIALDWKMSLIALVGAPVLAGFVRFFSRRIKIASKKALKQAGLMLGTITQSVQGIRVVKVHTAERQEVGRFNRANKRLLAAEMSIRRAKALSSPVVEGITMIGIIVLGGFSAWYILQGAADRTHAIAALAALGAAGASVRPLSQLTNDIYEAAAAADRLVQLLRGKVEKSRGDARQRLPLHTQSIEFRNVVFTYPNAAAPAIDGITLRINYGEVVAFVGPNGCGKTTLLSLIPRLFDPDSGHVLIDGTDIGEVSLKSLRQQIGVVTQETVIFNDSINNNIAYGSGVIDQKRIEAAAAAALADEFIRAKPEGYDTVVGEQGVTLSGGQRQRIAIARAILRNPRILILDEATSMIDADSEAQINAVLDRFCHDRTSLVIAHRLSTVINADRIVVMDRGRIVDIGAHRDLLDRCPLYQQLCRTQLGGLDAA
ncbi:MAG: ABC transporter ATP-binding protein/permease [Phycisphaerales bacterium]|nr:ABC transporter ATP-binding protein/permease [Phycisphaerales bacterium]